MSSFLRRRALRLALLEAQTPETPVENITDVLNKPDDFELLK